MPHSKIIVNPLHWIPEFVSLSRQRLRQQSRMFGSAVLVGIIAGLGAVVFAVACQLVTSNSLERLAGYRPVHPAGEAHVAWLPEPQTPFNIWMLLVLPAVGGILSGLLVFTLAPEAEGHGTDAVIDAYHRKQGEIRARVPIIKIVASALTIGTGGSGGREGPIAQIGAGFGSFLGKILKMRPAERRVLMAAGMGAGIAAIFRAPLAGALFASEVLYRSPEFEPEVIMPAGLASGVAYCTFGMFFGWRPLFDTPRLIFGGPIELVGYAVLVVAMVLLAMLYTRSFYGLTVLFHRVPVRPHLRPMIGAFASAVIGVGLCFAFGRSEHVLAVLSFGYGSLQNALFAATTPTAAVLLAIAIGKIFTTGLTIGSGGSGGVFGPSMVIGGCAGGALGLALHSLWPALAPEPATYIIVGMAGFFAAAAKTPFSTLVIVSEMTGDYQLILPALFVCILAFLLSDEQSIYSAQAESRALSPAHRGSYVREVLSGERVEQFVRPYWDGPAVNPADPLNTVIERFHDPGALVLPVVDKDRRLVGALSLEEVYLATQSANARPVFLTADLMRERVTPLKPTDRLDRALELFVENDLLALPVVDSTNRVIGMVRRFDVARAYLQRVHGPAQSMVDSIAGA